MKTQLQKTIMMRYQFADSSLWGIKLAYDQVHFTEEGHRVFADKIAELIVAVCVGER